jgi:hypothetical protein
VRERYPGLVEREATSVLEFVRAHHIAWEYATELSLGEVLFHQGKTAEAHFKAGVAFCDQMPIPIFQGTTREFYADMLMMRNAGHDRAGQEVRVRDRDRDPASVLENERFNDSRISLCLSGPA